MTRLFFRHCVLMLFGVCASSGLAHANDDHLNAFVKQLTISHNISQDQALTIAKQTDAMGGTVGYIRHLLRKRMAGIYAEYQPEFVITVRLTGTAKPPKKAYALIKNHPIRYELGAKHTVAELIASYDKHFKQIKRLMPSIQGLGVDERTGEIVINILEQDNQNTKAKNQIQKLLNKPVRFKVVNGITEL